MTTTRFLALALLPLAMCVAWIGGLGTASTLSGAEQSLDLTLVSTIHGAADLIEVSDGRAYVTSERTLTVYDVADPASPTRAGSYTFPEKIWGFEVVGSVVYAAVDFFGLAILDVSDIGEPTLRGAIKTPGQAKGVGVYRNRALVADHVEGVDLIDISDPSDPVALGSFYLDGYPRDVAAAGPLAFAVDAPTGVYVFDLSRPGPPEPIGMVQSARSPSSVEAPAPSGGDAPDVVCMVGGGLLQVYDVSNPSAPVNTADFPTPGGRPLRVTVRGSLAYVADGPAGLQVVDLSTPSAPAIVATYATPKPARDIAVSDSYVFVAVGEREGDEEGEVLVLQQS